ncbi:hypothetical protein L6452_05898 [Arctium lappa]|uniref:Uncharacterized protein n=1 Tax=Arctium lappa TaxID=4217 RepID=A0ACB9EID1_ARCLA|nr:hypothetical protein L6452_05898 [Arctium lappa]
MASGDSNVDGLAGTTEESSYLEALLKKAYGDQGWNYDTLYDLVNRDWAKCKLCGFVSKAGITRLKYHVAGIKGKGVAVCKNASIEDKDVCVALLENPKENKKEKRIREEEMRAEVEIENDVNVGSKRRKANHLGPMDKFSNAINPDGVPLNICQKKSFGCT